ncbi:MAG: hypothetical protein ACM3S5_18815 [Rhodospirillales bacterium]
MHRIFAFILLACVSMQAGTRIRDTVFYANGKRAEGHITITWPAFTASSGRTVAAGTLDTKITNGLLDLDLEPNPDGTSYTVRYFLNNGVSNLEYWIVPTSATAVTIPSVRTATIPTPNLQISPGQITQGGATTGQCMAWSGTSWAPVDCVAGGNNATQIQGRDVASTAPSGGMVLTWNAAASRWEPQAVSGGVPSVFGRTGAVTAQAGDYDVAQITGLQAALDGKAAAADLTAHAGRTDNPHTVTAAQVGRDTAQWNADRLQGQAVSAAAPADGQMMRYNAGAGKWEPAKVRHTVTFTEATTVTVLGSEHQLGTTDLTVVCYDASTPPNIVEGDGWVSDPVTFDVTIKFAVPQSGRCVLR